MRWHGSEGKGCSVETPGFQDVMTCQPTQDLFFPLLIGSESGMPSDKLVATPRVGSQSHTYTVNTQSAGKDRMEEPLQVLQAPAGTHFESGPDATPNCPEILSSLLPLTPAGFRPEQGFSEGLNEVQRLTGTTLRAVTQSPHAMNGAMLTAYQSCSPRPRV